MSDATSTCSERTRPDVSSDTSTAPPVEAAGDTHRARPAALLLHGLCSTPEELRSVANALKARGCVVQSLPIRGYSFDPALPRQHAEPYAAWLAQIRDRVEALRAVHDRVVLVGISAGASLALGATIDGAAQVDGMVLMSTTLRFDGWSIPAHHKLLPLALYTPLGRFWRYRERPPYGVKNERVRAWIEREMRERRVSGAGSAVLEIGHLREHDRLIRHVRRRLGDVRCPQVLALHAREDEVASLRNVELLENGLSQSMFRSVVLNDSFHMITIDNDRDQVVRETVGFVSALSGPP